MACCCFHWLTNRVEPILDKGKGVTDLQFLTRFCWLKRLLWRRTGVFVANQRFLTKNILTSLNFLLRTPQKSKLKIDDFESFLFFCKNLDKSSILNSKFNAKNTCEASKAPHQKKRLKKSPFEENSEEINGNMTLEKKTRQERLPKLSSNELVVNEKPVTGGSHESTNSESSAKVKRHVFRRVSFLNPRGESDQLVGRFIFSRNGLA